MEKLNLEEIGFFLYMEEMERKQKEEQEEEEEEFLDDMDAIEEDW